MDEQCGKYAAIITAAGSSQRMGGERKELITVSGRPLILYTVSRFIQSKLFSTIVVTTSKESLAPVRSALTKAGFTQVQVIIGGATRQESVAKALARLSATPPEFVLIHDGARPWVSLRLIHSVLKATEEHGAAAPVTPPRDTIKMIGPKGEITTHLPRTETVAIQTPQGFRYKEIREAHRQAAREKIQVTDDTELYARFESPVFTVEGERKNKKITYPEDVPRGVRTKRRDQNDPQGKGIMRRHSEGGSHENR